MVNDFYVPTANVCTTITFENVPAADPGAQSAVMGFLRRVLEVTEEMKSRFGEAIKVIVEQREGPVCASCVHRRQPPPRKRGRPPKLNRLDHKHSPDLEATIAALDDHEWDMALAAKSLGITKPAIWSRLQRFERQGYLVRENGKNTSWQNAERRF